jgi:hydrogenase maturation protease
MKDWAIIGIGNAARGDDGVGIRCIQQLREKKIPNADIIEATGEGTELMDFFTLYKNILICDAVRGLSEAGKIHFFDAQKDKIPTDFFKYSTHIFGLAEAIELSRALEKLPAKLYVYGIEGENFSAGQSLSSNVAKALEMVIRKIEDTVK